MPDDGAGGAPAAAAEAETSKVTILEDVKERREARKKRVAELAAADDEDIEKIKAHTMHKMVTDNANGTKVLFLTRKQAELVRKTWAVAHPPLDGTKAGETIVRTEADVADENVEA